MYISHNCENRSCRPHRTSLVIFWSFASNGLHLKPSLSKPVMPIFLRSNLQNMWNMRINPGHAVGSAQKAPSERAPSKFTRMGKEQNRWKSGFLKRTLAQTCLRAWYQVRFLRPIFGHSWGLVYGEGSAPGTVPLHNLRVSSHVLHRDVPLGWYQVHFFWIIFEYSYRAWGGERGRPWYGTFAKPRGHLTEGMFEKCRENRPGYIRPNHFVYTCVGTCVSTHVSTRVGAFVRDYNTENANFCGHSRVHLREHSREHLRQPFRGSIGSYFAFASSVLHWLNFTWVSLELYWNFTRIFNSYPEISYPAGAL